MPNSKDVFKWTVAQITLDEIPDEIQGIAYLLIEHAYGLTRSQVLLATAIGDQEKLIPLIERVNNGEPVQYIIGHQEFYGRNFLVNSSVLIPRPETELLIECVLREAVENNGQINLLDIGTGSGCIPITLALESKKIRSTGTDVSDQALATALANSKRHGASVTFQQHDILNELLPTTYDIIVSNPPYITESEKIDIKKNVLQFEPHTALFVPNNAPLLFYEAIAQRSFSSLKPNGLLAVEINERFGNEVAELLKRCGFHSVEILHDLAGKDRVVKARK